MASSKQMTTLFMKSDVKVKGVSIAVSIIEDDGPAREVLSDWIRHAPGFRYVSQHENGESALAKLPLEKPNVALMDINLPGMNGIECVRQLKPRLPDTQFVMLTVYEDTDHIYDALSGGASGYLLKQTPRAELLAALKDVYAGGSPMTSNIARKVVQSFLHPVPRRTNPPTFPRANRKCWSCWPAVISTRKSPTTWASRWRPWSLTSGAFMKRFTCAPVLKRWPSMGTSCPSG